MRGRHKPYAPDGCRCPSGAPGSVLQSEPLPVRGGCCVAQLQLHTAAAAVLQLRWASQVAESTAGAPVPSEESETASAHQTTGEGAADNQ